MNLPLRIAASVGLACLLPIGLHAATSPSALLQSLDKSSYSGQATILLSRYAAPEKGKAGYPTPVVDGAELLFERPDRFRLTLRPGRKDELTFVAQAGIARWHDKATGATGKAPTSDVADSLSLIALGTVGELKRYADLSDLPEAKQSPLRAARLDPRNFGTDVVRATAYYSNDQLSGCGFDMSDGSRVFVAILQYKANVQTKPGDFEL